MPQYTLHRNYVLRTTKGHTIRFLKGQAVHVPPVCVADAVSIGAVPAEGDPDAVIGKEEPVAVPLTPEERKEKIIKGFETMLARSERTDFGANGMPNVRKLSALIGIDVDTRERDTLWQDYAATMNETDDE